MLKRGLHVLAGVLLFCLGALVVFEQFRGFTMHAYAIGTSVMEPTLHCARPSVGCEADRKDRVLVPRLAPFWTPSRGDIVFLEAPPKAVEQCGFGGTFVKRLIGLSGETVSERNGTIFINGRSLTEPYVEPGRRDDRTGTWRVRQDEYFFLGDSRAHSCDSRDWGSVRRSAVIGPVVSVYWPLDRIGLP